MTMSAVEVIAVLCASIILVKAVLLIFSRSVLLRVHRWITRCPLGIGIVYVVLALIVVWYLLQEITAVQLFATVAFTSLFFSATLLFAAPKSISVLDDTLVKNIPPVVWALIVLWVFLAFLVFIEVFG